MEECHTHCSFGSVLNFPMLKERIYFVVWFVTLLLVVLKTSSFAISLMSGVYRICVWLCPSLLFSAFEMKYFATLMAAEEKIENFVD